MAPAPSIHLGGGESGSQRGTGRACWTVKAVATIVQLKSAGPVVCGFKHFLVCSISWGFSPRRDVSLALQITKSLLDAPVPRSFVCQAFLFCSYRFSSVQLLSRIRLFATPWTAGCQASLSITNSWGLLNRISIESAMPSNHLILCCPLLLLPSIIPSHTGGQSIGVSASASVLLMNIQD